MPSDEEFQKRVDELIQPGADLWSGAIKALFSEGDVESELDPATFRRARERFKIIFFAIYRLRCAQLAFESLDFLQRLEIELVKRDQKNVIDAVIEDIKRDVVGPGGMNLVVSY